MMSANRLTFNTLVRSHRFPVFHKPAVHAQNDRLEEENNGVQPNARLTETVVPLVNFIRGSTPVSSFNAGLGPLWLPSVVCDVDGALKNFSDFSATKLFPSVQRKVSTNEVSVQTECSGDEAKMSLDRLDQLKWELENEVGEELMKEGMKADAVRRFSSAAKNGNVKAMHNLGDCLFNGIGVVMDKREAFRFWRQAATSGHPPSMYSVGVCLLRGEGTSASKASAQKWIWRAANSGDCDAAFYLCVQLMRNGEAQKAKRLVRVAAANVDYRCELRSWVDDGCLPQQSLDVLKQELEL